MGYLLAQFWFPALVSLALGVGIGWLSLREKPTRWWGGWVPWGVGFLALGLVVALAGILPGRLGLWLELSLLLFVAYVAGCFAGSALRSVATRTSPEAVAPQPANAVEDVPQAAAIAPTATEAVAGGDPLPGTKPVGREAPRDGKPDDLRRIKGIGRQNAERLNALGIWHFYQIAAWDAQEVLWVGSYLAFPGRIEREDWVGQAKLLARGEETEFSRRVDSGEVETSRDEEAPPVRKRAPRKPKGESA